MNIDDWHVSRVCVTVAAATALSGCVLIATRRRAGAAHKRIIAGKSALNNYVASVSGGYCWRAARFDGCVNGPTHHQRIVYMNGLICI